MPTLKNKIIPTLTGIGCLWLVVQWLDWSRLLSFEATGRWEEYLLSRQIKLLLSVIVAVLVWTTGKAALSVRDRWLMRGAFSAIVGADVVFFLNNYYIGIGLFSLAQMVLIVRHVSGVAAMVQRGWSGNVLRLLLAAGSIGIVNFVLLKLLFVPQAANPMFPMITGYSFFLCCSLWAGIASNITGCLPKVNTRMAAIGVGILYLGDLTVGLNLILPHAKSYVISTSLTWLFYLPSILLLALSGYRWERGQGS
ncbi:MAG: hypothetical protein JW863_20310 [Chitinispirillaceae bacterium]|nr:hypothetical protein [Chitinispirillaceae bacterium]